MMTQNITLEKIKKALCPNKTNKDFVNLIFHPLKDIHQLTFTDSFGEKHLSSFMKGNHDGQKRLNVRKLKLWAEMICSGNVFHEMETPLAAIAETHGVTSDHEIYKLIRLDSSEMPDSLVSTAASCRLNGSHGKALLLMILWSVYGKECIDLLHPLYQKKPEIQSAPSVRLLSRMKPCRPVFKGRDGIIADMAAHFASGGDYLFLQGMGGIGKSECAKQYAERYKDRYDTIIFAEYSDSVVKLVNDNSVFTLTEPFISERVRHPDGTAESDAEFYQRKLTQLRLSADSRTLIILDNLDQYDEELENFLAGPFQVLVTTRWQSQSIYPHATVCVGEIKDMDTLKEIFSAYYGRDIRNDQNAEQLICLFQGHTMAIELIAKQMKASCLEPSEMLSMIKENGGQELTEKFLMPNYNNAVCSLTSHIQRLFDIAGLTDTERYVLMCLSLLPLSGMDKRAFRKCCGLGSYSAINSLTARSWIRDLDGILSMHTLVKETVQIALAPDLIKCKSFTDGLMREFTAVRIYHAVRTEKDVLQKIVTHIYSQYPMPEDEPLYDFYEWTELILSHCCLYVSAIELAEKLQRHYQKKYGDSHFRTARMMCRIGCGMIHAYRNEEAIRLLEQGRDVIKSLESRTVMQELYISDIDFTLSNQYMELYNENKNAELIDRIEMLCHETLEIRNRLYGDVEDKLRLSCVVPYRNLALIETIRGNYERSAEYLEKSLQQCEERGTEFSTFFRNYAKALYEISQHNLQGAISCMQRALYVNEHYFGKSDARSVKVLIELGELFEQSGDIRSAYEQYRKAYDQMKAMPYQDEKLLSRIADDMRRVEGRI